MLIKHGTSCINYFLFLLIREVFVEVEDFCLATLKLECNTHLERCMLQFINRKYIMLEISLIC